MTIQQAIWTLIDCRRLLINGLVLVQAEEITEAFDMAIEALNNVMDSENDAVKTEDDVIKRQDAVETVKELNRIINEDRNGTVCTLDVLSRIKKLPSATCDDCIWHVCNYNKIDWDGEDGYISRQDAVSEIDEWIQMATGNGTDMAIKDFLSFLKERIESLPSAEPKTGEWIPVKWHEITDEEREREGYPKDWAVYIDCEMPCDEQEILVQTKSGYVRWDVCYEDGGFSLDSGWDWIEDIVAWQPLPEPYREDGE